MIRITFLFLLINISLSLGETYSSFVEWNYPHLPKLVAWRETDRLILQVLRETYPPDRFKSGPMLENGSAAQWSSFAAIPSDKNGFNLVYLAAHQSPAAQWVLTDGSVLQSDQTLPKLASRNTIVLLDCCYAGSVATRWPVGVPQPALIIYASAANQPTPDISPYRRAPFDWTKHCPRAVNWLREHHFGGSDEKLSELGLIWLEAFLQAPHPPQSLGDWTAVAQTMVTLSENAFQEGNASVISIR